MSDQARNRDLTEVVIGFFLVSLGVINQLVTLANAKGYRVLFVISALVVLGAIFQFVITFRRTSRKGFRIASIFGLLICGWVIFDLLRRSSFIFATPVP